MQCSSPRASAGFNRLDASIAPSALPAPTRVCISSMNRMIEPSAVVTSCSTAFSRYLELAAVLGARNQRAHVKRQQLLVLQAFGHVTVEDAQRQPLDDRGLADAGFADQHGIVLGAAGQHMDGAADLLVAADHGIELAVARRLREVAGIFLQRVIGIFGGGAIRAAALAQRFDGRVEVLGRDAALAENAAGLAVLLQRQAQQQPLDRDKAVAGLLGGLFRRIEGARHVGGKIDLPGAASRNFRQLLERILGGLEDRARVTAGAVDQTAASPSLSSSKTLSMCSDENRCPSRMASDCADWTKPRARSVYFSIFISFASLGLPSPPGERRARHDYGIFIGDPRTALIFLNRPRVVARFSGLMQMWASRRKTEEARSQIRNGGAGIGNP